MQLSPLLSAAAAGLVATAPMTAAMDLLFDRLPWFERYPLPPSEITTVITDKAGVSDELSEPQHIGLTLLSHFAYGAVAGSAYAPLTRLRGVPAVVKGLGFGLAVWTGSYLGWLPALKILPPATQHPGRRNALMIVAHFVWGSALAVMADRMCNCRN